MQKNLFIFVVALFAYVVSCSLPDPGCDDHSCDEKCETAIKKHVKSIEMRVDVHCGYDSLCMARDVGISLIKELGWKSTADCYDGYEYVFVNDSIKKKISPGNQIKKIPLKDDHLRFSLFDEDNAEKKYDIDLSEIIHSYKYIGDSIAIKMPETLTEFHIECPYCTFATKHEDICKGFLACVNKEDSRGSTMMIGVDSSWGSSYTMKAIIDYPTAFGTDIINVIAEVEF